MDSLNLVDTLVLGVVVLDPELESRDVGCSVTNYLKTVTNIHILSKTNMTFFIVKKEKEDYLHNIEGMDCL